MKRRKRRARPGSARKSESASRRKGSRDKPGRRSKIPTGGKGRGGDKSHHR
jgi:hypothetical protein